MRVLLVYPPGWVERQPIPPCGISTLKASTNHSSHDVEQLDLEAEVWCHNLHITDESDKIDLGLLASYDGATQEPIGERLARTTDSLSAKLASKLPFSNSHVIGFSIMGSFQLSASLLISKWIKDRASPVIIFGGIHSPIEAKKIVDTFGYVDYVLTGEAWDTFPDFLDKINNRHALKTIPGLVFKGKNGPDEMEIHSRSIDAMPVPDYDGLALSNYRYLMSSCYKSDFNSPILRYLVGTGCPFRCNYCRRNAYTKLRFKTPHKIARELKYLSDKYNTNLFTLDCSEINPSANYVHKLCESIVSEQCDLLWYSYAVPSHLNASILNDMYSSGCRMLRVGVESGSQDVLDRMEKAINVHDMSEILRDSHKSGIWNQVNLIAGYPYERDADAELTCKFIQDNHNYIDSVRMHLFNLHHDTPLYCDSNAYRIKVVSEDSNRIRFDETEGRKWQDRKESAMRSLFRIHSTLNDYGIGYSGISSNLTFSTLIRSGNRDEAKRWLRNNHPYLYESRPIQVLRWQLYHSEEIAIPPFPLTWEGLYEW
jgi:radical SAM superfamily enzyme YgiQ (UPF0313 family)